MVIHEIAHRFFADLLNIPVYQVNYFTLNKGNVSGSVEFFPTDSVKAVLLVALEPLIINTFPSNSDLDYRLNVVKQPAADDRIIKDSTINNPVPWSIR